MSDPFVSLDATAQAELVRRGEVTPLELVDAAIARIERVDPALNAVITPLFEKARAAARGPLPAGPFRGVPFLLKDLVATSAGDPYHAGMRLLKRVGWIAREDSYLTAKLRAAGLVLCGKTNTPELGSIPSTEGDAYGPTRNPWNPARGAGGSSGGSAAAVAAGLVPIAHANDGGGSIRIPASACGVVGLKPTRGRVSMGPGAGESWAGLTAEFAVTRSVRDAATLLDVVAGPMPGDPYAAPTPSRPFAAEAGAEPGRLRVGLLVRDPRGAAEVHADCRAAAEDAARLLAELGHDVRESHPKALEETEVAGPVTTILTAWTARDLEVWQERTGERLRDDDVEPLNRAAAEMGRRIGATQYVRAVEFLHAHARRVAAWWTDFDLLLTPTLAEPPPPLGQFAATPERALQGWVRSTPFVCFTSPFNWTGQPAISLPLHWSAEGLPIGVQLVAGFGREDLLLRVAAQLEAARPWAARRPGISAF